MLPQFLYRLLSPIDEWSYRLTRWWFASHPGSRIWMEQCLCGPSRPTRVEVVWKHSKGNQQLVAGTLCLPISVDHRRKFRLSWCYLEAGNLGEERAIQLIEFWSVEWLTNTKWRTRALSHCGPSSVLNRDWTILDKCQDDVAVDCISFATTSAKYSTGVYQFLLAEGYYSNFGRWVF